MKFQICCTRLTEVGSKLKSITFKHQKPRSGKKAVSRVSTIHPVASGVASFAVDIFTACLSVAHVLDLLGIHVSAIAYVSAGMVEVTEKR